MNAINQDLHGKQVVVRDGYRVLPSGDPSLTNVAQTGEVPRVLCIPQQYAGMGAYEHKDGHMLFGNWLFDNKPAVIDARDIARLATADDIEVIRILQREMEDNASTTTDK